MSSLIRIPAKITGLLLSATLFASLDAHAVPIWGVSYNRDAPSTTSDQLIRFDSSSPNNVTVVGDTGLAENLFFRGLDFDQSGNLYGYANDEDTFTAQGLYSLNTTTGQATFIGAGGVDAGGFIWDLSYNPVTNTMYGIGNTGSAQNTLTQFYSIDLTTGLATKIGNVNPPGSIGFVLPAGLGTDAGGTSYILDTLAGEIEMLQGLNAVPLSDALGFNPYGIYGMTIDWSRDGAWYIAGQLNFFPPPPGIRSPSEFRTVDPTTGISTLVGTIGATGGEYGGPGDIAIMPLSASIPEPPTVALLGFGLAGIGFRRSRQDRRG